MTCRATATVPAVVVLLVVLFINVAGVSNAELRVHLAPVAGTSKSSSAVITTVDAETLLVHPSKEKEVRQREAGSAAEDEKEEEEEESPIVIRKGRYSIQPSWSPMRPWSQYPVDIAAFDYSGVTTVIGFTNTTKLGITLYQVHNKTQWKNNGTTPGSIPNLRFNATLHLINTTTMKSKVVNFTILNTLSQLNQSTSEAPYQYHLFDNTSGLLPENTYRVEVQKITEPDLDTYYNPRPRFVELHHFVIVGRPMEFAALLPVKRARDYTRRIEFIGDSITCGFCNLCKTTAPGTPAVENQTFALTWANLACDSLGADCHTISWSGIGIARDYGGKNRTSAQRRTIHTKTMLELYNHTLATVPLLGESGGLDDGRTSERWNFSDSYSSSDKVVHAEGSTFQSQWGHPQAVVINLGTNDFWEGKNISHNFTVDYLQLIDHIVSDYSTSGSRATAGTGGGGVKIFVACGPMSTAYCDDIFKIIKQENKKMKMNNKVISSTARRSGDAQLVFLDQRNVLNDNNKCCGHPDLSADAELGRITAAVIEAEMGWY